jgi:hypothetical protein
MMREIEGSFNLENLICQLYSNDLDPSYSTITDSKCREFLALENEMYGSMSSNGRWTQNIPYKILDKSHFPLNLESVLFHESVHYWQTLTCSAMQYRYISFLDRLALLVDCMNGESKYIGSLNRTYKEEDFIVVDNTFKSMNSNFNLVKPGDIQYVSNNLFPEAPDTAMPYIRMPHEVGGEITLPGYAAVLNFNDSSRTAVVPFSGRHIVESAALVSEHLKTGVPIPEVTSDTDENELIYLGVWEFWRRLFHMRYKSEFHLATGFLSVVDLVLNPDLFDLDHNDIELYQENTSIPYRFGKLVYRMGYLPILDIEQGELGDSIHNFQQMLSEESGWTSPEITVKKMIVSLSRIIVEGLVRKASEPNEIIKKYYWLFQSSLNTILCDFPRVESSLRDIQKIGWDEDRPRPIRSWPLGINILITMLHSLFYRLKYPGQFSAPFFYARELNISYPLPVVLFQGDYYCDQPGWSPEHPDEIGFNAYPIEVMFDSIGLAAMGPLAYGKNTCGFYKKGYKCYFMKNASHRCPLACIDDPRLAEREKISWQKTWCHWVFHATAFKTAPVEILDNWNIK